MYAVSFSLLFALIFKIACDSLQIGFDFCGSDLIKNQRAVAMFQ